MFGIDLNPFDDIMAMIIRLLVALVLLFIGVIAFFLVPGKIMKVGVGAFFIGLGLAILFGYVVI